MRHRGNRPAETGCEPDIDRIAALEARVAELEAKLLNVRLDDDDADLVRRLRDRGISISKIVRGAIRSEAQRLLSSPSRLSAPTPTILFEKLGVELIEFPASWWKDVFDWLDRYEEHEPDLAEAQLAVACSRQPEYRVWTYDREFRTIWRRSDGSRIPLATGKAGR